MSTTVREIMLVVCWFLLVMSVTIAVKNENTYKNHHKIGNAIFRYHMHLIYHGEPGARAEVGYEDMESYEATLFRLWDWGYMRILPPDKFELIKPFIKE